MKRKLIILCLSLILFTSGCGDNSTVATSNKNLSTTTSSTAVTTQTPTTMITKYPTTTTEETTPSSGVNTTATQTTATTTTTTTADSIPTTTTTQPSVSTAFKVTVRDGTLKQPIRGITVQVLVDDRSVPDGSGVTNQKGVVQLTVPKGTRYRVILSNVPSKYQVKPHYDFSGTTVNINLLPSNTQNENDHSNAGYGKGKLLKPFVLTDSNGITYALTDVLKDCELLILDFWYADCAPCVAEFPYFEAAVQKYGEHLALLAVNPIDGAEGIRSFLNQYNKNANPGISFPMLADSCKLSNGFSVTSFPTTVFVDKSGRILDIHEGRYFSAEEFFADIDKYLS